MLFSDEFMKNNFYLPMGAAAVFDTPAATPDNIKFSKNPSFFSPILNKLNHTERVKI